MTNILPELEKYRTAPINGAKTHDSAVRLLCETRFECIATKGARSRAGARKLDDSFDYPIRSDTLYKSYRLALESKTAALKRSSP